MNTITELMNSLEKIKGDIPDDAYLKLSNNLQKLRANTENEELVILKCLFPSANMHFIIDTDKNEEDCFPRGNPHLELLTKELVFYKSKLPSDFKIEGIYPFNYIKGALATFDNISRCKVSSYGKDKNRLAEMEGDVDVDVCVLCMRKIGEPYPETR